MWSGHFTHAVRAHWRYPRWAFNATSNFKLETSNWKLQTEDGNGIRDEDDSCRTAERTADGRGRLPDLSDDDISADRAGRASRLRLHAHVESHAQAARRRAGRARRRDPRGCVWLRPRGG